MSIHAAETAPLDACFTRAGGIYETRDEVNAGGLPEDDHDPGTARVWTLHMPYRPSDAASVPACIELLVGDVIDRTILEIPRVIGYVAGDDWVTWCEPREEGNLAAMHAYFEATPDEAKRLGYRLAKLLGVEGDHAVTTAGDWAEHAW